MIVKAKRFFISSVFGNVDAGRVIEMSDSKAKQLIDAGLVAVHEIQTPPKVEASSFPSPVEADTAGSSLPAGQVLPSPIVKESVAGAKVIYRKRRK